MSHRILTKGEVVKVRDNSYLVLEHRRGGISDVYLTFDLNLMEYNCFALKTLRPAERWKRKERAMLHREAAAWVSLGAHPNIVRCFYAADVNDVPYLVMEWISDEESNTRSLRDLMRHNLINRLAALRVASDLCGALLHCRGKLPGFAHGDIKPENVLVGEGSTFKLTDFGMARTAFSIRSREGVTGGQVQGTPHYMAPELWSGHAPDERTDVYAIGCLLYEVVEGALPFPGRSLSSVQRSHMEDDPQPPSLMTKPVWELVRRCLAKDAAERPAGYEELADMIRTRMRDDGQQAPPAPTSRQLELTATDYGNQALTLLQLGHFEEALEAFEKALALDPNLSRAYNNRAILFRRLEREEEALRDWARAIEIDPEFVEVYNNRAGFYSERGQFDLALRDAQRVVELNDRWPEGIITLAAVLDDLKRYEEALAHVNRALELEPANARGIILRGRILMSLERYEEAEASYTQALSLKDIPNEMFHKAYMQLLPCLMRVGKDSVAYSMVDEIVDPDTATFFGEFFLNIGEPLLALRALTHGEPGDNEVKQLLDQVEEKLIEMSEINGSRLVLYRSYRYWCYEPEKMIKELEEELQGRVTTAELRLMLDILAGVTLDTKSGVHPLLHDLAFRETFERVVLPRTSAARRRQLLTRFTMLERAT